MPVPVPPQARSVTERGATAPTGFQPRFREPDPCYRISTEITTVRSRLGSEPSIRSTPCVPAPKSRINPCNVTDTRNRYNLVWYEGILGEIVLFLSRGFRRRRELYV